MPKKKQQTTNVPEIIKGKDYGFGTYGGIPLSPVAAPLCFLVPDLEKNYGKEFTGKLEQDMVALCTQASDQFPTIYTDGTYPKRCYIRSEKEKKPVADQIQLAASYYNKILDIPEMENYPAVASYLRMTSSFLNSELAGGEKYKYASRVPDIYLLTSFPDWTDASPLEKGKMMGIKDFEKMLQDLRMPELWKNLDDRILIEAQLDTDVLSEEELKTASEKIRELNNKQIEILEHMVKPENKNLYTCWGGYDMDIAGERGYRMTIEHLKEENKALENGWDPRKISEYFAIKKAVVLTGAMKQKLEEEADPVYKSVLDKADAFMQIRPEEMKFRDQAEYDAFSSRVALQYADILDALDHPQVQKALSTNQAVNANVTGSTTNLTRPAAEMFERCDSSGLAHTGRVFREVVEKAAEHFKEFEQLDHKRPSAQYINMKKALYDVAVLGSQPHSLDKVNKALDALEKASMEYSEERSGLFKHGKGKERVQFADRLTAFAQKSKSRMAEVSKGSPAAENPDVDIELLRIQEKKRGGADVSKELTTYQKKQHDYMVKFAAISQQGMDRISQNISKLLDDAKEREEKGEKQSDSYKNLISAAKLLEKDKNVLDANPDKMLRHMKTALKASVEYCKEHKGFLSGKSRKGEMRVEAAASIALKLNNMMQQLPQLREQLPDLESGETLGWSEPDLYTYYGMRSSDRSHDVLSTRKINRRLHEIIEERQEDISRRVTGKPGNVDDPQELKKVFEDQKDSLVTDICKIMAANALEDHIKDLTSKPGNEHKKIKAPAKGILDGRNDLKNFEPFKTMIDSIKTWEDLEQLRDKALAGKGRQLRNELAKHKNKDIANAERTQIDPELKKNEMHT